MIDHDLVKNVHQTVGERLHEEQLRRRRAGQPELTGQAEQQFAKARIAEVIRQNAAAALGAGLAAMSPEDERELADAVYARMYGAGMLQVLLDDETIEEIEINGCDQVFITRGGAQEREVVDPVANSDEELISLIQTLGAYAGLNSRPWDSANPLLDLQLPDGSRLNAVMGVTDRPTITIRRNRFEKVELADLVGVGTLSEECADFLKALVRSRMNLMIAGETGAGKTTLLRALAAEIGPHERIVTVELTRELKLAADSERHPNCVEMEDRLANSEGHGAISMSQLVRNTRRMRPDRVIVGEVTGPEVVDMLDAMGQGNDGSMSTIHARSSRDTFDRIALYAIRSAERLPHEVTTKLIAATLDFVVYVTQDPRTKQRRLESVLEVDSADDIIKSNEIFAGSDGQPATLQGRMTDRRAAKLAAAGWTPPRGGW